VQRQLRAISPVVYQLGSMLSGLSVAVSRAGATGHDIGGKQPVVASFCALGDGRRAHEFLEQPRARSDFGYDHAHS